MYKRGLLTLAVTALCFTPAQAALTQITVGDLAGDASTLDFNAAPTGAISGTDTIFTNFGLTSAAVLASGSSNADSLNSGTFGNALGSSGGTLSIIPVGGLFDSDPSSFTFLLQGTASQFGFRVIDQINFPMTVEVLSGGSVVGTLGYTPSGSFPNSIVYFESDVQFDEFRISSAGGAGGWALDDITLASVDSDVPEPSTFALLGGALAVTGLYRRHRKA